MTNTPLSQRLQRANDELQLSTRQVVAQAEKGGYEISTYTATQVLNGKHGRTKPSTLEALAYVFRIPYDELAKLAGESKLYGVFELSPDRQADAQTLNRSQAELVYEIIRHLAAGNRVQQQERDAVRSVINEFIQDRQHREEVNDALDAEDHDLAASYGDEGISPDELPGSA